MMVSFIVPVEVHNAVISGSVSRLANMDAVWQEIMVRVAVAVANRKLPQMIHQWG